MHHLAALMTEFWYLEMLHEPCQPHSATQCPQKLNGFEDLLLMKIWVCWPQGWAFISAGYAGDSCTVHTENVAELLGLHQENQEKWHLPCPNVVSIKDKLAIFKGC